MCAIAMETLLWFGGGEEALDSIDEGVIAVWSLHLVRRAITLTMPPPSSASANRIALQAVQFHFSQTLSSSHSLTSDCSGRDEWHPLPSTTAAVTARGSSPATANYAT